VSERRGTALAVFRRIAPEGAPPPWEALADLAPGLGAVLGRPGLDLRTRQLTTICVLAALGGDEAQLEFHIGGALRAGATPREVVEALTQVSLYAGIPRAINAMAVARRVLAERDEKEEER
jgi:4-carboxymuconolactone decarboxylase